MSIVNRQQLIANSHVVILTTGGTIAMQHDAAAGGAVPTLGAADFTAALPTGLPELRTEELVNLPSSHFTLETLRSIRERVAALAAVILQGLLGNGMGKGPALALLLAGPALSLPNMLVIRSVMGTKKTVVFVTLVIIMATITGLIYGAMM